MVITRRKRRVLLGTMLHLVMVEEEEDALLVQALRRRHRFWMHEFLKDRTDFTVRNTLAKLEISFLRTGAHDQFRMALRMDVDAYRELLDLVRVPLTKQATNWRKFPITPEERLSLTMRYLALGDSIRTLSHAYLIGYSTVGPIIREVCGAIYWKLHEEHMKTPTTRQEWLDIAANFEDRWNFPHCIGAVDGKHIRIKRPPRSGSLYFNYKRYFSVVLLAIVDADYNIIAVDCGANGACSDSTLFKNSSFFLDVLSSDNPLDLPRASSFPGVEGNIPYFFVGDDAFAMSERMMKPYAAVGGDKSKEVFNYRLSRARRIVENVFGILAARFRILRREWEMWPQNVAKCLMAMCVLHNFLRKKSAASYTPLAARDWENADRVVTEGNWRRERPLDGMQRDTRRNYQQDVKELRERLRRYFITPQGAVHWQYRLLRIPPIRAQRSATEPMDVQ